MNKIIASALIITLIGCKKQGNLPVKEEKKETAKKEPHKFGGWYCPDNLNEFPPVDIQNWKNVPVIEGRLPSKEEAKTEASLMYIDPKEYPNAKALDIDLPKLATYFSEYSNKLDYVIIIQAVEIDGDSIVGFRYLNGGNGSARFNEVNLLTENDYNKIPSSRFVKHSIKINATQDEVWKAMKKLEYNYVSDLSSTSKYADKLFGCWYIQNDYVINELPYVEKFLLLENTDKGYTELKIVCGPYSIDYEKQNFILIDYANKVKELSQ